MASRKRSGAQVLERPEIATFRGEPVDVLQRVETALQVQPGASVTIARSDLETLIGRTRAEAARERIDERARDALDPQGKFAAEFLKKHGRPPKWADRAREALRIREISEPFFKLIARPEVFLFAERIHAGDEPRAAIQHVARESGLTSESAASILRREREALLRRIESYGAECYKEGTIAAMVTAPMREILSVLAKVPSGR